MAKILPLFIAVALMATVTVSLPRQTQNIGSDRLVSITPLPEAGGEEHPEDAGQVHPTHEARMPRAKSGTFRFGAAAGFADAVLLLRHGLGS